MYILRRVDFPLTQMFFDRLGSSINIVMRSTVNRSLSNATRARKGCISLRRFSLTTGKHKLVEAEKQRDGEQTHTSTNLESGDKSAILHSKLDTKPPTIVSSNGNYLIAEGGREILDASGGAAVACIGHNNSRVNNAIMRQLQSFSYIYAPFFTSKASEKLATLLSESTQNQLSKAFIVSSGMSFLDDPISSEPVAHGAIRYRSD